MGTKGRTTLASASSQSFGGILVVKQFREEDFRQNGVSPRARSVISSAVIWAARILRHGDGVFGNK